MQWTDKRLTLLARGCWFPTFLTTQRWGALQLAFIQHFMWKQIRSQKCNTNLRKYAKGSVLKDARTFFNRFSSVSFILFVQWKNLKFLLSNPSVAATHLTFVKFSFSMAAITAWMKTLIIVAVLFPQILDRFSAILNLLSREFAGSVHPSVRKYFCDSLSASVTDALSTLLERVDGDAVLMKNEGEARENCWMAMTQCTACKK